ncbi:MAG: Hsp70 family protein [Coprococcus sp.]
MIERNSAIPTKVTKPSLIKAGSLRNGETEIYVLQGENDRPLDNVILEKQVIGGIEATKNKDIIIDVTYEYTLDGMVLVSAVQKDNNKMLTVHSETLPEDMSWTDLDPDSIPPIGPANGLEIVMCLDTSGSMYNSMDKVRDAGLEFINNLDFAYTKVAILEFESYVHQRLGLTDKNRK